MTGPEHYEAAEKLLAEYGDEFSTTDLAAAQIHATLALAAATALATPDSDYRTDDDREWYEAAGLRSVKRDSGGEHE